MLSFEQTVIALLGALLGALIQGSVGFGFALVVVPVLTLMDPTTLPATILILAVPLTLVMSIRERGSIDGSGLLLILAGRVVGTAAGVWLLVIVPDSRLAVLLGAVLLASVLMSAVTPPSDAAESGKLLAGIASGIMGTAAAIGGPPLALAYQSRPGPQLRSTLAASFVVGSLISLAALWITGQIRVAQVLLALELLPAVAAGLYLSRRTIGILDHRWLRPAVLAFAGAAGLLTLLEGLLR
ncbi:MAG TPA: sulfite exporter TauE/SafE family protein [Actinomycetota bacterium]|jgi:uncharacterized membrane protein YfcA|nr:sulfite exporter TauE/SafE family protein [Actinomycetota bacterium]